MIFTRVLLGVLTSSLLNYLLATLVKARGSWLGCDFLMQTEQARRPTPLGSSRVDELDIGPRPGKGGRLGDRGENPEKVAPS